MFAPPVDGVLRFFLRCRRDLVRCSVGRVAQNPCTLNTKLGFRNNLFLEAGMFIRNDWYIAAWGSELGSGPEAKPLGRKILNEDVVLFRDQDGKVAALENRCAHRGVPLSCGEIVEKGIQCG
jgi:hypothetical protein